MSEALFGLAELDSQLREALAAQVLQLHALVEVLPDPLVGVELRSVAGSCSSCSRAAAPLLLAKKS
ncbi:MAG: hypothetical protein M3R38_06215, partial [Actinomycetota bacterium]|nr:hypothetical protein [Actinomycetota bacterium]